MTRNEKVTVEDLLTAWVDDIDSEPLRTEPLGDDGQDPRGNR